MKKRELAALGFQKIEEKLQCPICSGEINVIDNNRLVCDKNHSFDLAKQGYVNMLGKQVSTMYDHELFEARKNIIQTHKIYDQVHQFISNMIQENIQAGLVFDAGSGEGSHLNSIFKQVNNNKLHGLGLDISKDGVLMAAKNYSSQNWIVGDLTNTPFSNHTVDIILSFLSPANYKEFERILKGNGLLIKVIPGSHYLKEIRQALSSVLQEYENTDTVELMKEKVHVLKENRITYQVKLDIDGLKELLKMTPLAWHANEDQINRFLANGNEIITVDLHIVLAKF